MQPLQLGDKTFQSRLFTGTGKFASNQKMEEAILASESQLVTVALRRVELENSNDDILKHLKHSHINLLPNTSGVRTAKEAVFAAQLAREALDTNWLKLADQLIDQLGFRSMRSKNRRTASSTSSRSSSRSSLNGTPRRTRPA